MSRFQTKKLYYSISEVSKITGVPHYLIRKWETVFAKLAPARNSIGNRIYANKDISVILGIKKATKEEGYTIEKAKQMMDTSVSPSDAQKKIEQGAKRLVADTETPKILQTQIDALLEVKGLVEESLSLLEEIEVLENVGNTASIDQVKNDTDQKDEQQAEHIKSSENSDFLGTENENEDKVDSFFRDNEVDNIEDGNGENLASNEDNEDNENINPRIES